MHTIGRSFKDSGLNLRVLDQANLVTFHLYTQKGTIDGKHPIVRLYEKMFN
jgi:hypothetical protein